MGKQAKSKALKRQARRIALSNTTVPVQEDEQQSSEEQPFFKEESTQEYPLEERVSSEKDSQELSEKEGLATGVVRSKLAAHLAEAKQYTRLAVGEAVFRQRLKQSTNTHDRVLALFNLCTILEKKELYPQAFDASSSILQLVPDDKAHQANYERLKILAEQCESGVDPAAEEERIKEVERVGKAEQLREVKHVRHEIREQKDETFPLATLPRTRNDFLQRRQFPSSVTMKIVLPDSRSSMKPLFNSQQEHSVYKILLELFPNYLIYPNMPLLNLFSFEQMKEILDGNEFEYFLKAHVDFCITKISDYYPLVAFEVDSEYHDEEERIKKDEMKNRICCSGGLELVRLRPYGQLTEKEMRQEIISHIQRWGDHSALSLSNSLRL